MARDFYGFTYNGTHSSELNLYRVSNGNRYEEGILPGLSDTTTKINGVDGSLFFGSTYSNKTFPLQLAYDELSERNMREMRQLFGDGKLHPLIFDEAPYKVYTAKVSSAPTLQYICFTDYNNNSLEDRIYKGEGSIDFIAYSPFAKSRYKWIEDYNYTNIPEWINSGSNMYEWLDESGIISKHISVSKDYDTYIAAEGINVYNGGDLTTPFKLKLNFVNDGTNMSIPAMIIKIGTSELHLNKMIKKGDADGVIIDMGKNLIEGIDINGSEFDILSGNVYNEYIAQGSFYKMPLGASVIQFLNPDRSGLVLTSYSPTIEYNYLYL